MNIKINKGKASGCVLAPPSKSVSHRCLIAAMMGNGVSRISNIAYSDDIIATLGVLKGLGCGVIEDRYTCDVFGLDFANVNNEEVLDCRESGSTLRFMIPILLCFDKEFTITGTSRLLERPLDEYERICRENGFKFERKDGEIKLCGCIKSGTYRISSAVSSQFATGLIFALSMCEGESHIIFEGNIASKSYIDMTMQTISYFGGNCTWVSDNEIFIGQERIKSSDVFIEGDESNAAFLFALNELGSDVCVNGLNKDTLQGDAVARELFKKLDEENPVIDIENCPDLAPVLMAVASFKHGCVFKNTHRLSYKESDRSHTMKTELEKFGAHIDIYENEIKVYNTILHAPEACINCHNDHRIAMACAVLCTYYGGTLDGAECVKKSYPDFFEVLRSLNIETEEI